MGRRMAAILLAAMLLAAPVLAATPGYGAEWLVIAQCAGGTDSDEARQYWDAIQQTVADCGGVLDERKYTEYSRVILAVTAAGHDARDVAGYDLTAPLADTEAVMRQGVSGVAAALLALDSGGYPCDGRQTYVAHLLSKQLEDGGWALSGQVGDVDVTAMALQALAPYRAQEDAAAAVERGLSRLSAQQKDAGGFASYGVENCESCAQVILALCQLGLPVDDARFVKNGCTALDAMNGFRLPDGSYCHQAGGEAAGTATEQAKLALASLQRAADGLPGIYTMTAQPGSYGDIAGHWAQAEIERAVQLGLFRPGGSFRPEDGMIRGQLAAALWRAAGSPEAAEEAFADVPVAFVPAVAWARSSGVMNGVSATRFAPYKTLTRAELAVALWRMAGKPGASAAGDRFSDWNATPDWARDAVRWAIETGLMNGAGGQLKPGGTLTRAQTAAMLVRYMEMEP